MIKKAILLSQRLTEETNYKENREALDVRVGKLIAECDFVPVPVSIYADTKTYFYSFHPQGIILTGGNDLEIVAPGNRLSKERDRLEQSLINIGLENDLPIFGICRGAQMLAHFFDGVLEKHNGHANVVHPIEVNPESILSVFHSQTKLVTSHHQFCVTKIDEKLFRISARADDKTIEAFEHKEKPIMGIMWHPERVEPFHSGDISLIKNFFLRHYSAKIN